MVPCYLGFGFLAYRGAGRYSKSIKDLSTILMWGGAAAIVAGIILNSYLGNIQEYLGVSFPYLLNGIEDAITLLIISLFIGIVHLYLGIFLGAVQMIRDGKTKDAITQRIVFYPLSLSGFIVITHFTKIRSFKFFSVPTLSEQSFFIVLGVMLSSALIILIDKGPLGFFEFTGFLGDWLSYARILALGLATSGLALTVNLLAGLMWGKLFIVGFLLAIVIFIAGHVINCGLQVLGAYIHSLRLQYVEFFSKFYDGRGKLFKPYIEDAFYTK